MTTSGTSAPLTESFEMPLPAEATAGTGQEAQLCVAPWAGTLAAASYIPEANVTGVATNNKSLTIRNRGAAGSGNTVMATLALGAGTNATAFDEKDIPLSGTPANLAFNQGDVLTFQSTVGGTGMTLPEAKARVTLSRS
jgi:hypothetical protein